MKTIKPIRIGDKVTIQSEEWYEKNKHKGSSLNYPFGFVNSMKYYLGKTATVIFVDDKRYENCEYHLDICTDMSWSWSRQMFKSVRRQKLTK